MDDALVLNGIAKGRLTPIEVLILVVMDDALVPTTLKIKTARNFTS